MLNMNASNLHKILTHEKSNYYFNYIICIQY